MFEFAAKIWPIVMVYGFFTILMGHLICGWAVEELHIESHSAIILILAWPVTLFPIAIYIMIRMFKKNR